VRGSETRSRGGRGEGLLYWLCREADAPCCHYFFSLFLALRLNVVGRFCIVTSVALRTAPYKSSGHSYFFRPR